MSQSCTCMYCEAIVPPARPCPRCAEEEPTWWYHDRSWWIHAVSLRPTIRLMHALETAESEQEVAEVLLGGPVERLGGNWYRADYVRELEEADDLVFAAF